MIDLGTVKPGTTLYVPFATYDSNDPSASVTITGLATTDIEIYKDGSVTQRASDAGYSLLDTDGIDFDATTGIHGFSIDLSNNTTAGFYAAGSQYWVIVASITVDAATINFIPVTFRIGYPNALLDTSIATLSTQTSFTLTSGPAEDNALNGMWCIIHDVASSVQLGTAIISDYTGSTKTVTLAAATTFTVAATDNISIMGMAPLQPTTAGNTLSADASGRVDVGSWLGTAVTTSSTTSKPEVDIYSVSDDATSANNMELQYDTTGLTGSTFPATQAQLTNIVAVGAATNVPAESYTLTTGTQSANTYVETAALDAVRHQHIDTAGAMELYYQFDIGGDGAPVSATMVGYLVGGNDSLGVYAYNWSGASWDQIGTLQGGAASDSTSTYALYAGSHVGTGANLGKVRIRFYAAAGLSTATLAVDQLYVSYATVTKTVGYANGSFWINTVNGTAGTVAYFNGTADKPVDTLADAQTLSATVPLNIYTVSNDSSITLSASFDSSIMTGAGYTLAFGGQSISGSRIIGANVSGTCTGANPIILSNCTVNAVTLPIATIDGCNIETGITLGSVGEYHIHNSHCGNVNGIYIDFGAALGDNQILVHGWQGEIELRNMGQLGADVAHLAGDGILTIAASCTGGTVYYQGSWDFTDNSGGAVTFIRDDNTNNITSILTDTGTTLPATLGTPAGADLATDIASIQTDTNDLQTQIGTAGAGLTDLGGMSTAMKVEVQQEATDALNAYDPPTNAEMEARTPTVAQLAYLTSNSADGVPVTFSGGTTTTAILVNVDGAAASSVNDYYNGRILIFNAGTLQHQATDITDYDGATKTATITAVTTAVTGSHTANMK